MSSVAYINNYGVQVGTRYFARVRFTYDDFGNAICIEYFDTNDKLVSNYPFASKESEYDETGHEIADHYFDAEGNVPRAYFSDIIYGYDDYGNIVSSEYFGENKTPLETRTTSGKMPTELKLPEMKGVRCSAELHMIKMDVKQRM